MIIELLDSENLNILIPRNTTTSMVAYVITHYMFDKTMPYMPYFMLGVIETEHFKNGHNECPIMFKDETMSLYQDDTPCDLFLLSKQLKAIACMTDLPYLHVVVNKKYFYNNQTRTVIVTSEKEKCLGYFSKEVHLDSSGFNILNMLCADNCKTSLKMELKEIA